MYYDEKEVFWNLQEGELDYIMNPYISRGFVIVPFTSADQGKKFAASNFKNIPVIALSPAGRVLRKDMIVFSPTGVSSYQLEMVCAELSKVYGWEGYLKKSHSTNDIYYHFRTLGSWLGDHFRSMEDVFMAYYDQVRVSHGLHVALYPPAANQGEAMVRGACGEELFALSEVRKRVEVEKASK